MYIIRNVSKMSVEDKFEEGEVGSYTDYDLGLHFSADTAEGIVQKFADYFGANVKEIEKNVCDEPGRIEWGQLENADGLTLSKSEYAKWKNGNLKAWSATYTGYVEKCEPVTL